MGTGEKFLNRTPIAYALRSRIDKWDIIKLQSFCKAKDNVKRTKWQPTNWEKIFTNPTSDRGIISNIYKELKTPENQITVLKNGVQNLKNFHMKNFGGLRNTLRNVQHH